MPRVSIAPLVRVTRDGSRTDQDLVAVEAPLSIELLHLAAPDRTSPHLAAPDRTGSHPAAPAVTHLGLFMRTPGDDEALALGLLFAEGVIHTASDVTSLSLTWDTDEVSATLRVSLASHVEVDAAALARSGVSNTACGLCGRLSSAAMSTAGNETGTRFEETSPGLVFGLPQALREAQAVFAKTGGLHAAAFFDHAGQLIDVAEDVGRHNAVDKLVGRALQAGRLGAHDLLVVSGRVAYEIVQKAAMAGVRTLVAVGAPSSLAVQAARDTQIMLIGFAKNGTFNVYTHADRLVT